MVEVLYGEGGDDAKHFADELTIAYYKYIQKKSLDIEQLKSDGGHHIFRVSGNGADFFYTENGKHCVQRTSGKKKHTSIVSVTVSEVREETIIEFEDSDFQTITQRGHGSGGQHQNKTDSAVRMRHLPTGLEVFINGRSQYSNKRTAYALLIRKVEDHIRGQQERKLNGPARRSDKMRTYNFLDGRVVDHRSGVKITDVRRLMKGDFDLICKR